VESVKRAAAAVGLVILALGIFALAPGFVVHPEAVHADHADPEIACRGCHSVSMGVPSSKCLACHPMEPTPRSRGSCTGPAPAGSARSVTPSTWARAAI